MRRLKQFGCHLLTSRYDIHKLLDYAIILDENDYDLLTVGDHTLIPNSSAPYPNAHTVLSAMGSVTKKITLSTAVTDSYRRHPAEIAQGVATLDQITYGRAALGIGGGEMMNLIPFGIEWQKPFTRLKEAIETIRLLWRATPSEPANYSGKVFSLHDAYLQIRPFQQRSPRIYVGALGPKTRELTGAMAQGWIPMAAESPSTFKDHLADVRRGAKKSGRSMEKIDASVILFTDVSDDYERAYGSVDEAAKGQLIQERDVLRKLTGIEVPEELSVQKLNAVEKSVSVKLKRIADSIPRKVVEEVTAFGSEDQCISRIEKYLDAGATTIIICNLSREQEKVFGIYGKRILPYLRGQYGQLARGRQ